MFRIQIIEADITTLAVNAIVDAANVFRTPSSMAP